MAKCAMSFWTLDEKSNFNFTVGCDISDIESLLCHDPFVINFVEKNEVKHNYYYEFVQESGEDDLGNTIDAAYISTINNNGSDEGLSSRQTVSDIAEDWKVAVSKYFSIGNIYSI